MATRVLTHASSRAATVAPTCRCAATRGLHNTSHQRASILFALQALSNSRETQHFNKISRLNRVEHSPSLKLIQSSEVDPYAPGPQAVSESSVKNSVTQAVESRRNRKAASAFSGRALALGQALLSSHSRSIRRSQAVLARTRGKLLRRTEVESIREAAWEAERNEYRAELRSAGALIVVAIGIATAAVTWRLGVEKTNARAEITSTAETVPALSDSMPIAITKSSVDSSAAATPIIATQEPRAKGNVEEEVPIKTWKSLLWKRD